MCWQEEGHEGREGKYRPVTAHCAPEREGTGRIEYCSSSECFFVV